MKMNIFQMDMSESEEISQDQEISSDEEMMRPDITDASSVNGDGYSTDSDYSEIDDTENTERWVVNGDVATCNLIILFWW